MAAETTEHFGYEWHAPEGRELPDSRSGWAASAGAVLLGFRADRASRRHGPRIAAVTMQHLFRRLLSRRSSLWLLPLLASTATAQCATWWQQGDPVASPYGGVAALTQWDADGSGPNPPMLVAGGNFRTGYTLNATATYDGGQWTPLGAPPGGVTRLAVHAGQLFCTFATTAGIDVAVWTGAAWQPIGSIDGWVRALASYGGELIVAGTFTTAGGVPASNVARWNGTQWAAVGGGVTGDVNALAVFSGSLYVGGNLTMAGSVPVSRLAAWTGSNWAATATFDNTVSALAVRNGTSATNSYLYVGGYFSQVGAVPANRIARVNGIAPPTWQALGSGVPGSGCTALMVRNTGLTTHEVVAGIDGNTDQRIWRYSGSAWTALGTIAAEPGMQPRPNGLTYYQGAYVCGLDNANRALWRFDGSAWRELSGDGIGGRVHAVLAEGNDLVIGGAFPTISGVAVHGVARGGPGAWQPLGTGFTGGANPRVLAFAQLPNGDLVAGGEFTTAGGLPVDNVARWNGGSWSPLGAGLGGTVRALVTQPNGSVVAGGDFTTSGTTPVHRVAMWNGTQWSAFGSGMNGAVHALLRLPNGDLVAGGAFTSAGGVAASRIARWSGAAWSPIGAGFDGDVRALAMLPNGDLLAGGSFAMSGSTSVGCVARWNGVTWSSTGATVFTGGDAFALAVRPDGAVAVGGGRFALSLAPPLGTVSSNLLLYDHGTWTFLDLRGQSVDALAVTVDGAITASGSFQVAGNQVNGNLARRVPSCVATTVSYGVGCAGGAGPTGLEATTQPWLGTTFRARATGMPSASLALAVWGFGQIALPLPAVLPQGLVGCTLLATPDAIEVLLPIGGELTTQLVLPANPSLAGSALFHQVAVLELSASLQISAVTSTDALALTIGAL